MREGTRQIEKAAPAGFVVVDGFPQITPLARRQPDPAPLVLVIDPDENLPFVVKIHEGVPGFVDVPKDFIQ